MSLLPINPNKLAMHLLSSNRKVDAGRKGKSHACRPERDIPNTEIDARQGNCKHVPSEIYWKDLKKKTWRKKETKETWKHQQKLCCMKRNTYLCQKVKTMKKNVIKEQSKNIFQQMLEDKQAIRRCIQRSGDLKELAKKRGIRFANPI